MRRCGAPWSWCELSEALEEVLMTDDNEKTLKRDVIDSLSKARGFLQQSLPEIAKLIKRFDMVERAQKISDSKNIETISEGVKKLFDAAVIPREVIKHAASDFQLKDLFSKIEAFIARANPTFVAMFSKEALLTEAPTKEPLIKPRVKKSQSKKERREKTVSKKLIPRSKAKRSRKEKMRTPH
jgi:hypothetical protein